ncbi:MAG: hypothetical protein ACLU4N_16975 [Butyricimonas faecihominis]
MVRKFLRPDGTLTDTWSALDQWSVEITKLMGKLVLLLRKGYPCLLPVVSYRGVYV